MPEPPPPVNFHIGGAARDGWRPDYPRALSSPESIRVTHRLASPPFFAVTTGYARSLVVWLAIAVFVAALRRRSP